ncbi:hypothetical protein [Phenylobacterium ferrooxidans]|uniref:Alpha/beta hydrolase n=1 Tax=Phenylobacterium ferrooxidans TaxID=2982689 RepID=A0ABW6CTQ1_9CAUL
MKVLGLPGRKPETLGQMQALIDRLEIGQTEAVVRPHSFWDRADVSNPDISPDAQAVSESGADLVISKSIGNLIVMLAGDRHGFAPQACVFLATPLARFIPEGWIPLLEAHCAAVPTLFIQQTANYNGAYRDLAAIVARHPLCTAREIPGDDHRYEDVELVAPLIEAWVNEP